jgi:transcriptional regulator with XRE-family HTH domain
MLVKLLEERGISEREVARRADLSHSTVNHLVTGRRSSCALLTALAIEGVLGVKPSTLFVPETPHERLAFRKPT